MEKSEEEGEVEMDKDPQLSLNTIYSVSGTKVMGITGEIHGSQVEAWIDSGASLNFINPSIASELRLSPTKIRPVAVRIANIEQLRCEEKYVAVDMQLQGYNFSATMYSLPIFGVDVILGLLCLESLGPVLIDYKLRIMSFIEQDNTITLKGHANREVEPHSILTCRPITVRGCEIDEALVK